METKKKKSFVKYLIPGFIFQSVVIGGGYGTGAEIAQYFGVNGLVGGLLGMCVTLVVWSVLCAVTFEFVRIFRTFDYNSLMHKLLGKAGVLYEICYVILLLIVLGVINATAGSMIQSLTGLTPWLGVAILSAGIVLLVMKGTEAIEKALSFWSYVLYAVYLLFMIVVFVKFSGNIGAEFAKAEVTATGSSTACSTPSTTWASFPLCCTPSVTRKAARKPSPRAFWPVSSALSPPCCCC